MAFVFIWCACKQAIMNALKISSIESHLVNNPSCAKINTLITV